MTRMVDPPNGWKYGFPKSAPNGHFNIKKWLLSKGYPQKEIDALGDKFFIRSWEEMDHYE